MTGIGQLQTLAHLFQADAASAFICHAFGMIAVGYFAMYLSGAFTEVDTDKAGLGGGDAMLEGILYEGNKDERSYFSTAVWSDVYLCFHTDVGGETDAHQFDVVADEVHLLVQGDEVLLIVIQHMAQQSAQFLHGSLCLVGIEGVIKRSMGMLPSPKKVSEQIFVRLGEDSVFCLSTTSNVLIEKPPGRRKDCLERQEVRKNAPCRRESQCD